MKIIRVMTVLLCFFAISGALKGQSQTLVPNIKVGLNAPDFNSRTSEGEKFQFSKIMSKGKLTLLEFWASWCQPCRKEIPIIKQVYERFHEKGLNIIGIGLENSRERWETALEEEDTPWMQVSQLEGRGEDAARIYGVGAIPAYVLIDDTGKIVCLDLPGSPIPSSVGSLHTEKLYKKLEELLNKK